MLPKPLTMFKFLVRFALFSVLFLYFLTLGTPTNAGCGDYFTCQKEIQRVKGEISRLQGEANTLKNQIAYLDNQIYLTQLEIEAREAEIKVLSGDIGDLSTRLERIGNFLDYQEEIFANRARLAYASDQLSSFDIVLGAENLDDALRRIKYLHVLEDQDIQALNEMRDTRASFNDQKKVLENKKTDVERLKTEVEEHKSSLINQQSSKEYLLTETRGQESLYQGKLKFLQAELNSILAALRSGGTRIGPVTVNNQWVRVANQGNTGCSYGSHVHYAVGRGPSGSAEIYDGTFVSPFSSPARLWMSGSTVRSGTYWSPGGPVNTLTGGYTSSHKAIDVVSKSGWNGSSYGVYASASGTAYLVKDTSWYSWCRDYARANGWPVKAYNGPAYGIVIDHGNGWKTLYWHTKP
jgi:peptidoglycan hydrolase CwlO-like protein